MSEQNNEPIELLRGSFGDNQPRFMVLVNQPVTSDQIDKIAELLSKIADEGRAQAEYQLADQAQEFEMGYGCHACNGSGIAEGPEGDIPCSSCQ